MATLAFSEWKRLNFTFHTVQLRLLENWVSQTISNQSRIQIYVEMADDSQAIGKNIVSSSEAYVN